MITINIDNTDFTLRPENVENTRALCASIRIKGKGRKFKPKTDAVRLNMVRQYPLVHNWSTYDYVAAYEELNRKIFGGSDMTRWALLNTRPAAQYDSTMLICVEDDPC